MVLEESTRPVSESISDGPYPSDADTYSSTGPQRLSQVENIDFSDFPKPMPIIGPLTGVTVARQRQWAEGFIREHQLRLQRPLSQDEASALAYYSATMTSQRSWGYGTGIILGVARAYQTRATWKIPLMVQRKDFDPNNLMGWKGPMARRGWVFLRYLLYAGCGVFGMGLVTAIYSISTVTGEFGKDRRLDQLRADMEESMKRRAAAARQPRRQPFSSPGSSKPVSDDNMSPTTDDSSWSGSLPSSADTGVLGDSERVQLDRRQEMESRSLRSRSQFPSNPRQPQTQQHQDYDSDSPTGGYGLLGDNAERSINGSSKNDGEGGSAWDRIRRGAAAGGRSGQQGQYPTQTGPMNESVQREPRQGSTLGDSFSFAKTDEERQLAKDEAQRDFDARIERERRGENFEDTNRRRW
jgi:hypothetical protein